METPGAEIGTVDPYQQQFSMYYDRSHKETREPACFMVDVTVTLETNVREIDGGGLIWSGLSQSFNPRSASEVIWSVSRKIVKDLEANGLLGSPLARQAGRWVPGRSARPTGAREQTPPAPVNRPHRRVVLSSTGGWAKLLAPFC